LRFKYWTKKTLIWEGENFAYRLFDFYFGGSIRFFVLWDQADFLSSGTSKFLVLEANQIFGGPGKFFGFGGSSKLLLRFIKHVFLCIFVRLNLTCLKNHEINWTFSCINNTLKLTIWTPNNFHILYFLGMIGSKPIFFNSIYMIGFFNPFEGYYPDHRGTVIYFRV
jgi:hypothetical protein